MPEYSSEFRGLNDWIHVFSTGRHRDSSGKTTEWSAADLDSIVRNHSAEHPAPLVIGHPKTDSPRYGSKETGEQNRLELYVAKNQPDQPQLDALGDIISEDPRVWVPQGSAQLLRPNMHTLHEYTASAPNPVTSYALASTGNVEADWVSIEIQETP